jgi:predicted nucleic acid-binding protein
LIVDTSALLAFFDRDEPDHLAVSAVIVDSTEPLVSPFVLAELDYLVGKRLGAQAELAVLEELVGGAWDLATMNAADVQNTAAVIHRYRDQQIGIADASNVVLAARYRTLTVVTLDRRHFTVLRPLSGGRCRVLPRGSRLSRGRATIAGGRPSGQSPRATWTRWRRQLRARATAPRQPATAAPGVRRPSA